MTRFAAFPNTSRAGWSTFNTTLIALLTSTLFIFGCGDDSPGSGDADAQSDVADLGGDAGPLAVPCVEGDSVCYDGRLATCLPGGTSWLVESCPVDEVCIEGECLPQVCEPGDVRCEDDAVVACLSDGSGWTAPQPCEADESCIDGTCASTSCDPGERVCSRDRVLICDDDGSSWIEEPSPEDWGCFLGECIQCLRDADCVDNEFCHDGLCISRDLTILTDQLQDGMVDQAYSATLLASGGLLPYAWSIVDGSLPSGVSLNANGNLGGTPSEGGLFTFTVEVSDDELSSDSVELSLMVHTQGLVITTERLPSGEEGMEYSSALQALGGTPPYAWMVATGALPNGIVLTSNGQLAGVPTEIGDFVVSYGVFDNAEPTSSDSRELTLTINIAPLEIIGDQEYDLFIYKLIVLPLITVIEGIPVPYSTQLQARGGLRPYSWEEEEIPGWMSYLIATSGIPNGLTLHSDGRLSGAVSSSDQVVTLDIPFSDYSFSGFFFMAKVSDAQSPAESRTAIFLIPTIPIGF